MRDEITLRDVQAVYSGPEGELWELVMGQQIHIGGFRSSMELAEKAGVGPGMTGVDLCCCNGRRDAFSRPLPQRGVGCSGVDATETVIERGRHRCDAEGLADRIDFTLADVCQTGLPDAVRGFRLGRGRLVLRGRQEAADRRSRPAVEAAAASIAFTDWVDGRTPSADGEADRYHRFMKFPNTLDIDGYAALLADSGCEVLVAEDTGRFAPHVDLYLNMLNMQLTYDALRIIGFDFALMESLGAEMNFLRDLAHAGKIAQGQFIARKKA